METAINTARGIKNTKRYARHGGVEGRFSEEQSVQAKARGKKTSRLEKFSKIERAGKIARQVAMGNAKYAAEQAAITAGSGFVERKTQEWMKKKYGPELEGVPKEKMTGSAFWAIVALAIVKDAFDIGAGLTVFLSPLSSPLAVVVGLVMFAYFVANEVKFTTKKIVTSTITAIAELIPFLLPMLPLATLNLFAIKYFEKSERLQKLAKRVSVRM